MTVNQSPQGGQGGVPPYSNGYSTQGNGMPPYGGGYPPLSGGYMPQPPQKKPIYKRVWFWIIAVVVLLGIIGTLGDGGNSSSDQEGLGTSSSPIEDTTVAPATEVETVGPEEDSETDDKGPVLVFHATATGSGTVVWGSDGSTNTEDFTGEWSMTLTGEEAKGYYSFFVSGDYFSGDAQEVTCEITRNDKQLDFQKGTGAAGSASCSTLG